MLKGLILLDRNGQKDQTREDYMGNVQYFRQFMTKMTTVMWKERYIDSNRKSF